MPGEKPSPIGDLPSTPWHRKTLLYRYGPESLKKHFDVALEIFEKGTSTERFEEHLRIDAVNSLIEVGRRLEWLKSRESELIFEPIRFRILFAYQSFFLAKGRIPFQAELLALESQIEVLKQQPRTNPSLFSLPSREVYLEASKVTNRNQRDRKTRSEQLRGMGLRFLDGQKFRKYSAAYERAASKGGIPEYPEFLREAGETHPPDLLEIPISTFFEFLSAPVSIDPYAIWKSNLILAEDFSSSLSKQIPGLAKRDKDRAKILFDVFMILGAYYQHLADGSDLREILSDTADLGPKKSEMLKALTKKTETDLSPCAPEFLAGSDFRFIEAVSEHFFRSSQEKCELPSYFEFWFMNPGVRSVVQEFGNFPANYLNALKEFSDSFSNSNAKSEKTLKDLVECNHAFRTVLSALNPWWNNHEKAVYFDAISMSDSGTGL